MGRSRPAERHLGGRRSLLLPRPLWPPDFQDDRRSDHWLPARRRQRRPGIQRRRTRCNCAHRPADGPALLTHRCRRYRQLPNRPPWQRHCPRERLQGSHRLLHLRALRLLRHRRRKRHSVSVHWPPKGRDRPTVQPCPLLRSYSRAVHQPRPGGLHRQWSQPLQLRVGESVGFR